MVDFSNAVREAIKEIGPERFARALKREGISETELTPERIATTLTDFFQYATDGDFSTHMQDLSLIVAAKCIAQVAKAA